MCWVLSTVSSCALLWFQRSPEVKMWRTLPSFCNAKCHRGRVSISSPMCEGEINEFCKLAPGKWCWNSQCYSVNWEYVVLEAKTLEFWDMFEKAECFPLCPFSSLRLKGNNKIKIEKDLEKNENSSAGKLSAVQVPTLIWFSNNLRYRGAQENSDILEVSMFFILFSLFPKGLNWL